jgi:short-subunit dehydrogenase
MNKPVVLISGVGPGTGAATAKRFASSGYHVAMLARDASRLAVLENEIDGARGFICDMSDPTQVAETAEAVTSEMGAPEVVVYNAVAGSFGGFLEIDPKVLAYNFQVNTMGLLYLARALAPKMVEDGHGSIIVTGNTSSQRGKANFAGFAPSKAAQRILAESMARDLGPKGIHVAYLVIDAVIDLAWTRKRYPEKEDHFFIKPSAIAEEIWHLAHQNRSAWSFNVELRPASEPW